MNHLSPASNWWSRAAHLMDYGAALSSRVTDWLAL
jgi:hypothetical protein